MTDRKKLIELMRGIFEDAGAAYPKTNAVAAADHLIANGVTVQRHGRWIDNAIALAEKCSVCGEGVYWDDGNLHRYPYCPNCGTRMNLKGETE